MTAPSASLQATTAILQTSAPLVLLLCTTQCEDLPAIRQLHGEFKQYCNTYSLEVPRHCLVAPRVSSISTVYREYLQIVPG